VYWTTGNGQVMRVNKDGGGTTTLYSNPDASSVQQLVVDDVALYWIDTNVGAVYRLAK